jgi:hypothetical protein
MAKKLDQKTAEIAGMSIRNMQAQAAGVHRLWI